jgi:phospholipid/cholesterol/gamma-HCH transport system permease protein
VIRALREVEGGLRLFMNVALRMGALRRAPVRESFLRQVYFTGVTASTGVVLRASGLGALIIAFTMQVLDADTSLAVKILLWVVLREVGPLAAAMVVILRTGTAMSAELAMMRISGQTDALRSMGIEAYDYLVVPRVAGVMLATAALTSYIQFLAVAGGMILSPFVIQASFTELYTRFFDLVAPVDFAYSILKSLMFGFAIALTCCYHGLNPPAFTLNGVPQAVTRAVTQSAVAVLTINAIFAYLVFGVLFFGLVKAVA